METAKVGNLSSKKVWRRWKLKRSPVYHLAQEHRRIYDMTSRSTLRRVELFVLRYVTSDNLRFQKFDEKFFPSSRVQGVEINSFNGVFGNHQDLRNFGLHKR